MIKRIFVFLVIIFYVFIPTISIANFKEYAIKNGLWTSQYDILENHSVWWLRSPGIKSNYAALIYDTGSIGDDGDPVETFGNGIRPSIRVKYK